MSLANQLQSNKQPYTDAYSEYNFTDVKANSIGSRVGLAPLILEGVGLDGNGSAIVGGMKAVETEGLYSLDAQKVADLSAGVMDFSNTPLINGVPIGSGSVWNGDATSDLSMNTYTITFDNNDVRIGTGAGDTNQSANAIAIGANAGNDTQGTYTVAIGSDAGNLNQQNYSTAIGYNAGNSTQGENAVAIGYFSGVLAQGNYSVAIGSQTAQENQGTNAVAIGNFAGSIDQGAKAVAIGDSAGETSQGANAIAIGAGSGRTNQGANAIMINTNQNIAPLSQVANSIVLNASSGPPIAPSQQTLYVKPIRNNTGTQVLYYNQASGEVSYSTPPASTWVGTATSDLDMNTFDITNAGTITASDATLTALPAKTTETDVVYYDSATGSLSYGAGGGGGGWVGTATSDLDMNDYKITFNIGKVRIGNSSTGAGTQGNSSIAIGANAGAQNQGIGCIAIGENAGEGNLGQTQGNFGIALGQFAGRTGQGNHAIAIGRSAGQVSQANSSIVMSTIASIGTTQQNNPVAESIVINADATAGAITVANKGLYVAPIRVVTDPTVPAGFVSLYYNPTTKEIIAHNP